MKCVRIIGQGVPVRISDREAKQIVERDKDGEYCSKAFWRNWYADAIAQVRAVEKFYDHSVRIK